MKQHLITIYDTSEFTRRLRRSMRDLWRIHMSGGLSAKTLRRGVILIWSLFRSNKI
ncbi:hypothetical protein BofuT4_uP095280.1 [Botrytis cinerea T4]|uniref:Uncharacterized protein n=1 Tax=Botryotinia fuckeliana (strain T4) TaxID=999810 RepID=G2YDH2_BOTF4|nr:hypothetical protein BofuT4_uP095280.1 [Botrytis cinerea T4]